MRSQRIFALCALFGLLAAAPSAEAGFYKRGHWYYDASYPDVEWLSVETEHFIIHYYPEIEFTARMMAKYAEIMYPKVTGMFDFPLKEKVHIVLRDQEENANGFAVYNSDWVTVWATPLYYPLRGRQEWIPDCVTHEFTHIVSLKTQDWKSEAAFIVLASGLIEDGTHNLDIGAQVLIGFNEPYWWAEGVAEYGTHMAGFNWWTTARDMMQRSSFLEDNYLTYHEMFTPGNKDSGFDRERGYQQGYATALYVMEKFGKEQFAQLAVNSGKKGHLSWDKNIEDVLGVDGQTLYEGWVKWMKERYDRQVEPIRKAEHVGRDLTPTSRGEEIDVVERLPDGRWKMERGRRHYPDPPPLDEEEAKAQEEDRKAEQKPRYEYWDKKQRKRFFEKDGNWNMLPKASPDGRFTAFGTRKGIMVFPIGADEWPTFSGHYLNMKRSEQAMENLKVVPGASVFNGYDFSPDSRKIIFSSLGCPDSWAPCVSMDGYYRYDLYTFDIFTEDVERLSRRLRAIAPSYSPDGKWIAFVHIEDGQNWLGVFPANARDVAADGTCTVNGQEQKDCITWLIKRRDGTQLGAPSWSPDSQKIVIDLYRNRQQDVWMVNADGSDLVPLTWDRAEDRDSAFTRDGKHVLYISDRTGIFNAYMMNLETRKVTQLTNVTNGVFTPFLTPAGNLLYAYFTSYGLRIYGHHRDNFYNQPVEAGYDVTPEEVARFLAYEEPLPEIRDKSYSYNPFSPKNWMPIEGIPLFIYERKGTEIGVQTVLVDYLEKHRAIATVLLGQQMLYAVNYVNNFWYPSFFVDWAHADFAFEFTQQIPTGGPNPTTVEPHFGAPLTYKGRQSVDWGEAGMELVFNDMWWIELMYKYRYYASTEATANQARASAFLTNNSYGIEMYYDGINQYAGEGDVNPRGRSLAIEYWFTRTGLPSRQFADVEWLGRTNPPGDSSDDYTLHEIQVGYREAIPIMWWNDQGDHTLEFNFRAGWQNRNVFRWDEFFGGSLHPQRFVPTQSTTNEFAGYPPFSISGETMLIFSMNYRFPFWRKIDKMFGPFYFASLWGEVSFTAGNLWGYTANYVHDRYGNIQRNTESYWDPAVQPGSVRREVPFVDMSAKNGNYMLYDVGFTLKLKAYMFGYIGWNSFIRVAYPFNTINGAVDVNNDDVFVDAFPNDAMKAEVKRKALRFSIGIGSDFD